MKALSEELGSACTEWYVGSVSDPNFVQDTVDMTVRHNGAIHGLVNNAGIVRAAMIQ